jgi:hypothetical protein
MVISPKVKLFYIIFLIFFLIGIYLYLLDSWGIISLKNYLPFLEKRTAGSRSNTSESTSIRKRKIRKRKRNLRRRKA